MAATQLLMKLGMDGKGFSSGISKAKTQVKGLRTSVGKSMRGMIKGFAAMATVALIGSQIKKTVEWAAKIRDLSTTFGISAISIQKLEHAAQQSGIELEVVMDAMKDLGKNTSEAMMGVESKVWAFKQLGIDANTLVGMDLDQVFIKVANAIKNIGPVLGMDQIKAIEDLMGGAGFQSIVMFKNGVEELGKDLQDMGAIVDQETIEKIAAMDDKLAEFAKQNRAIWGEITGVIIELWMKVSNLVTSSIEEIQQRWVVLMQSLSKGAESAGALWNAILNKDIGGIKRAGEMLKEAVSLGAEAMGGNVYMEIGDRIVTKEDKLDRAVGKKKADLKKRAEAQKIVDIGKERMKQIQRILDLEKSIEERKFNQLSPEQKLLAIQKKQREELEKMFKLQPTTGDVTSDPRVQGLTGIKREEKLVQLEKEKADYLEQEQVLEGLDLDEAEMKKKIKADRVAGMPELAGGIKETYGSLARIGGQLGAKNPLIAKAEEQLKVQKSSDLYLANISQVTTMTFGG